MTTRIRAKLGDELRSALASYCVDHQISGAQICREGLGLLLGWQPETPAIGGGPRVLGDRVTRTFTLDVLPEEREHFNALCADRGIAPSHAIAAALERRLGIPDSRLTRRLAELRLYAAAIGLSGVDAELGRVERGLSRQKARRREVATK